MVLDHRLSSVNTPSVLPLVIPPRLPLPAPAAASAMSPAPLVSWFPVPAPAPAPAPSSVIATLATLSAATTIPISPPLGTVCFPSRARTSSPGMTMPLSRALAVRLPFATPAAISPMSTMVAMVPISIPTFVSLSAPMSPFVASVRVVMSFFPRFLRRDKCFFRRSPTGHLVALDLDGVGARNVLWRNRKPKGARNSLLLCFLDILNLLATLTLLPLLLRLAGVGCAWFGSGVPCQVFAFGPAADGSFD